MRPLLVKARLAHGIAHAAPWGVSLDGLLAAEIWADQKAGKRDRGEDVAALSADVDPEDLDLPLARCELSGGDLWHWAATCAYPEKPVDHPVVRYWTGRPDHAALGDLVADLPGVVSERQGPYRSRSMPLLVTSTDTVTWQCVGDDARIMAILQGIAAIGKKRSQGEGRVLRWEVTPLDESSAWSAGHLHADGSLGRPTPDGCLHGTAVATGGRGPTGLRPPYMHAFRRNILNLPFSRPA
ncbi:MULTISPECIES: hypothetical protein [Rhodococcus erythropolis group]|uniref:hypothetical protein n=1 Tax=Rhodococcus erythropolis group TaxID=2840174 RepID=UPI001C601A51|nr:MULTISPECIES: hypothetical protein [Rhodococcus erythropolis group]MBW4818573.1 hypothetical protein [Rhodococcus qingshengii]